MCCSCWDDAYKGNVAIKTIAKYLVLFPYVSPLPIASSLQPFFLALLAPYFLIKLTHKRKYPFEFSAVLIFFIYCLAMLIPGKIEIDINALKKLFAVPASLIIISFRNEIILWLTIKRLKIVTSIYALVSVLQATLGQTFGSFTEIILNRNGTDFIRRGANSLTTEPSFAGHIAIAFLLLYLIRKKKDDAKGYDILLLLNIFLIAVLSKSATAVVSFLIVFIGAMVLKTVMRLSFKRLAITFFLLCVVFLVGSSIPRLVTIFDNVRTYGPIALLNDASIAARILQPYFGLKSLIEYPLGLGIGSATEVFQTEFIHLAKTINFTEYAYRRLMFEMNAPVSVLGQYMVDTGIVILLLTSIILWRTQGLYKNERMLFIFISLLQSHSFMYPFIWLLTGKIENEDCSYNRK